MDVLRPKILKIDGRRYRLNTTDCCPNECDETEPHNIEISERLPSYVERDGKILGIYQDDTSMF